MTPDMGGNEITLNEGEIQRLNEYEDAIERGLATFVDVGNALLLIREGRLYRGDHGTFEQYCQERWNLTRPRAYQLMDAAEAVSTIVDTGLPAPANEGQARELKRAAEEERADVWRETLDRTGGKPTASAIRETREERAVPPQSPSRPQVPPPAPAPQPTPAPQPADDEEPGDEFYAGPWMPDAEPSVPPPPAPPAFVRRNTGENEWYTPAEYTAAARDVMDGIDLDPASTAKANEKVHATNYWTAEDDGLAQPWAGRVWLNPPYERGLVDKFCTKLAEEYEAGNVTEAIVLVNNSTDSAWFHELLKRASAICFPLYRVRFWNPDGRESNPLQGQAALYMGPLAGAESFKDKFGVFGQASLWKSLTLRNPAARSQLVRRKPPLVLTGTAVTMLAVACSSSPSTRSGTETISGTVTGQPAAAMMNTSSNVQPVFPVFSFAGVVSTANRNYTLPGGNSNAKTATDTFVTPAGNLTVTHTRTYAPSDQTPPSLTGQTGNVCHFTLVGEKGTYVTVPSKSTGQFKDATGHGTYLITINIGAKLPAGKTACSISDYGAKGPTAIAAGTSFVFSAAGSMTVKS